MQQFIKPRQYIFKASQEKIQLLDKKNYKQKTLVFLFEIFSFINEYLSVQSTYYCTMQNVSEQQSNSSQGFFGGISAFRRQIVSFFRGVTNHIRGVQSGIQTSSINFIGLEFGTVINITMFIMAIIASIMIFFKMFGDSQIYVGLILLAYIAYIWLFKFGDKHGEDKKRIIGTLLTETEDMNHKKLPKSANNYYEKDHEQTSILSQLHENNEKYGNKNSSQFLNDYQRLNNSLIEGKKKMKSNQHQMSVNQASVLSLMNRSAEGKKNKKSKNQLDSHQFGYSLSSLLQSKQKKTSESMKSSKITNDLINKELMESKNISNQIEDIQVKCTESYLNTLKKINQSDNFENNNLKIIKKICLKIVGEVYQENIQNLGNIVKIIEQNYQISVDCNDFADFMTMKQLKNKSKFDLTLSLPKLLEQLLNKKISSLPFHERQSDNIYKKQSSLVSQLKQTNIYYKLRSEMRNNPEEKTLERRNIITNLIKLIEQRKRLDQMLAQPVSESIKCSQILQKLSIIHKYIKDQSLILDLPKQFEINQRSFRSKLIVFNIVRNKINEFIGDNSKIYWMTFDREYFFGFLRKSESKIRLQKISLSIPSFQHYNINYKNSNGSQMYYACFGPNNCYCLLYYHLQILYKNHRQLLTNNRKLCEVVSECLNVLIV